MYAGPQWLNSITSLFHWPYITQTIPRKKIFLLLQKCCSCLHNCSYIWLLHFWGYYSFGCSWIILLVWCHIENGSCALAYSILTMGAYFPNKEARRRDMVLVTKMVAVLKGISIKFEWGCEARYSVSLRVLYGRRHASNGMERSPVLTTVDILRAITCAS